MALAQLRHMPAEQARPLRIVLALVAVATSVLLLQFMQPVLIPLVFGALLFYALDRPVDWLQRKYVPRAIGAALLLILVVSSGAWLAYTLQGQALAVVNQLPSGARKLAASLRTTKGSVPEAVEKVQQAADTLEKTAPPPRPAPGVMRVQVEEKGFQASAFLWSSSLGLLAAANQLVIILFLTYFLLLSDKLFKRKLVEIVGSLSRKKTAVVVLDDIAAQIERFIVVQVLTSALVAVATWAALWALGMHQAALWGLLAGIFNSIPYYGPLLVTAGLSTAGFLQFGSFPPTLAVAGASLAITTFEGLLVTPLLMGRVASMNPVAVFVGLLFWSWIWGIWGLLLAVPMTLVIKVICEHVEPLQPVAHLLGE
jgi:predicted PurR-regulated permease PerM